MKTIDTIIDKYAPWKLRNVDGDFITDTWDKNEIRKMMLEMAKEVIMEIVNNPVTYINDVGIDKIPNGVLDKGAFRTLQKSIK